MGRHPDEMPPRLLSFFLLSCNAKTADCPAVFYVFIIDCFFKAIKLYATEGGQEKCQPKKPAHPQIDAVNPFCANGFINHFL